MKYVFFFFSIFLLSIAALGQVKFEPGYYITNDGVRKICEIKNLDWKNNPTSMEFRSGEGAESKEEQIGNVTEFGLTGGSTFKRFAVDMDRSSELIERLDRDRNPVFARETLLLRVLSDGKATLYQYEEGNLLRFFYSVDQAPVQQLVYKRYLSRTGSQVVTNDMYKQQILNGLTCGSMKKSDIEQIGYTRKDLMKMFSQYNDCQGSTVVTNEAIEKKSVIHLTLRPGLTYNFLQISSGGPVTEFERKASFRIGLEMETVLPFSNGVWAILFEPVYQSYSSKTVSGTVTVDYKSLDLTAGVRRYVFVSEKGKAYANLGIAFGLPLGGDQAIKSGSSSSLEVFTGINMTVGVGYTMKRLSAEINYAFPRGILGNYLYYTSIYAGPGLIVGYRIM